MNPHSASCRCDQLRAVATGTPTRISVCHCLDCQKRSGSTFANLGFKLGDSAALNTLVRLALRKAAK